MMMRGMSMMSLLLFRCVELAGGEAGARGAGAELLEDTGVEALEGAGDSRVAVGEQQLERGVAVAALTGTS